MNRGFNNLPPGMGPFDSDQSDIYTCSVCHEGFDESELDPNERTFGEHVCRECAARKRERAAALQTLEYERAAWLELAEAFRGPVTNRTAMGLCHAVVKRDLGLNMLKRIITYRRHFSGSLLFLFGECQGEAKDFVPNRPRRAALCEEFAQACAREYAELERAGLVG